MRALIHPVSGTALGVPAAVLVGLLACVGPLSLLACGAAEPTDSVVVSVPVPPPQPEPTAASRTAAERVPDRGGPSEQARVADARVKGRAVVMAVELWQLSRGDRCPTFDDLVSAKVLDDRPNQDPWGQPYSIACEDGVTVRSKGPDRRAGTPDDVTVESPP